MSNSSTFGTRSPLFKQKHSQRDSGDKALSNLKFFQQVVNMKEKYEQLHSTVNRQSMQKKPEANQKVKETDHFLTLYERYISKQKHEPTQNLQAQSFKSSQSTQLQQSSSLHQLSHCFQQKLNTQQTFNNNLHRFSLDNFKSQQAHSTDLSQSRKGLKSFMSSNNNNKSSSISNSFNSRSFKHTSVAKEEQQRYSLKAKNLKSHSKEPNLQPSQFMSSYFSSNKHDRSDEQNNLIKYISLGGRSQTIDQIEFQEQNTGRESHPSLKVKLDYEPSKYENILQNLIYRSNQQSDDKRRNQSNTRTAYNKSQLSSNQSKARVNEDEGVNEILQLDQRLIISTQFNTQKPISQPQSTKNVDSPYQIVAQQSLTSKMARDQSDIKNQKHYFQFPNQQDGINMQQSMRPNKHISISPIELQNMLNRTQHMLERYRTREIRWIQEREQLLQKLKETTEKYQQSQREVKRLTQLI